MRGLVWCSMIVLGGCSATNPAYDDDRSNGTMDDGSTSSDSADSSGSGPTCELHPLDEIIIEVRNQDGPVDPSCGDEPVLWLSVGNTIFEPPYDGLLHDHCPPALAACPCLGEQYEVSFSGTLTVPPGLPTCGPVAVWAEQGPGGCEWAGVMLQEDGVALPAFIAARTLEIPPLFLSLELGDQEQCGPHGCDHPPGRHPLVFFDQSIRVAESPVTVPIAFGVGAEVPYEIDNRMSSVDEDCEAHIAWTATIAQ